MEKYESSVLSGNRSMPTARHNRHPSGIRPCPPVRSRNSSYDTVSAPRCNQTRSTGTVPWKNPYPGLRRHIAPWTLPPSWSGCSPGSNTVRHPQSEYLPLMENDKSHGSVQSMKSHFRRSPSPGVPYDASRNIFLHNYNRQASLRPHRAARFPTAYNWNRS